MSGYKVVIKIRTEDDKIEKDFLLYEPITLSHDCPKLQSLINQTKSKYHGQLIDPDITITVKFTW